MRILRLGVVCAVPLLLIACGGSSKSGGGSSSPSPQPPATAPVSGMVSKGPVAGAQINIYRQNNDGSRGSQVAGPIVTAEDGHWNAQIPETIPRPLLVVSSGGRYVDEATGAEVDAGTLNSFLPEDAETVAVTPLTDLLVQVAHERMADGATAEAGIAAGKSTLASVLTVNFDPLAVVPADPANPGSANPQQVAYAAVLGGLSKLAQNVAPGVDSFDVVKALVSDMTDGKIDGQAGGSAVTVGADQLLTITEGTDTLTGAINEFTSENENFPAVEIHTATFTIGDEPVSIDVLSGGSVTYTFTPQDGYIPVVNASPEECAGELVGNTYTTSPMTGNCSFGVSYALAQYTVATQASEGGAIAPEDQLITHGESVSFEINPDVGYHIASVEGCDGELEENSNIFTTGAITAACTVTANFAINTYTITAEAGDGGTVSPAQQSVNHGGTASVTASPQAGFEVHKIGGSCNAEPNGNTYTIANVTADCSMQITFAPSSYAITANVNGEGGSIAPGVSEALYGGSVSFTLTPDVGHEIATVNGCGGVLQGNTYTVNNITAACNVTASFTPIMLSITASAGPNGSISPLTSQVAYGSTATFNVSPAAGYQIASVSGCGGSLNGHAFTTGEITAACSISATFVEDEAPPAGGAVWNQFNWDEATWQ